MIKFLLILLAGKGIGLVSGPVSGSIWLYQIVAPTPTGGLGALSILGWERIKRLIKNIQAMTDDAKRTELSALLREVKTGKMSEEELLEELRRRGLM